MHLRLFSNFDFEQWYNLCQLLMVWYGMEAEESRYWCIVVRTIPKLHKSWLRVQISQTINESEKQRFNLWWYKVMNVHEKYESK